MLTLYPGVFGEFEWRTELCLSVELVEMKNFPDRQDETPTSDLAVCQSLYLSLSLFVLLLDVVFTSGSRESHFGLEYKPPIC